jgi:hypothetical protein
MNKEEGNQCSEFSLNLSAYISNAVKYLDNTNGRHEMTVNDLHLLESSKESKINSRVKLGLDDTNDIAKEFLDNESLN